MAESFTSYPPACEMRKGKREGDACKIEKKNKVDQWDRLTDIFKALRALYSFDRLMTISVTIIARNYHGAYSIHSHGRSAPLFCSMSLNDCTLLHALLHIFYFDFQLLLCYKNMHNARAPSIFRL